MKTMRINYLVQCQDTFEVPDDWEYEGDISSILEYTDLPFVNGDLYDWESPIEI